MALMARPTLKTHVLAMNGGPHGWVQRLTQALNDEFGGRSVSRSMVEKVVTRQKTCPKWLALALVRYVEKQPYLTDAKAEARLADWFEEW